MPNNNQQEKIKLMEVPASLIIESLLEQLEKLYIFPEPIERVRKVLENNLHNGEYESENDPKRFTDILTEQLYEILCDKHVRVYFIPAKKSTLDSESNEDYEEFLKRANYAFRNVEILSGNIGYLDLIGFVDISDSAKTVSAAAMTFLTHTDALIIDLRSNGGGSPEMVAYLTSYLFTDVPVHLNSLHLRSEGITEEFWTHSKVVGPRYGINKPIYILIGKHTFSGAEEFAYNLQTLKRATLIGEVTGGGAHPGDEFQVYENYYAWIPTGRAINPYTNSNWEGVGVTPDISVSSSEALEVAHIESIDTLLASAPPENIFQELTEARHNMTTKKESMDN